MKEMQDVWEDLKHQELDKYKETMEYCKTRVTANEGIPAVLGLDDLTAPWDAVWQGPEAEKELYEAVPYRDVVKDFLKQQPKAGEADRQCETKTELLSQQQKGGK